MKMYVGSVLVGCVMLFSTLSGMLVRADLATNVFLEGFVYDSDGNGMSGVLVEFLDTTNSEYWTAYTNTVGWYISNIKPYVNQNDEVTINIDLNTNNWIWGGSIARIIDSSSIQLVHLRHNFKACPNVGALHGYSTITMTADEEFDKMEDCNYVEDNILSPIPTNDLHANDAGICTDLPWLDAISQPSGTTFAGSTWYSNTQYKSNTKMYIALFQYYHEDGENKLTATNIHDFSDDSQVSCIYNDVNWDSFNSAETFDTSTASSACVDMQSIRGTYATENKYVYTVNGEIHFKFKIRAYWHYDQWFWDTVTQPPAWIHDDNWSVWNEGQGEYNTGNYCEHDFDVHAIGNLPWFQ